jgi:hypothetical protein
MRLKFSATVFGSLLLGSLTVVGSPLQVPTMAQSLEAQSPAAQSPAAQSPAAQSPAAQSPVQLEVGSSSAPEILVVGAEKTQKLRLKPQPGNKQEINVVWQIQTAIKAGDREMPNLAFPTLRSSLSSKVNEVNPNGDIRYQVVYNGIQSQPKSGGNEFEAQIAKAIDGQLGALAGLRGDYVLSELGESKSAQMTLPDDLTPIQQSLINQFSQAAANLSAPFPANGVGIGGVWRQFTPIMINGMEVKQTATYRLTDLQDGVATIALEIEQTAPPQVIATGDPKNSKLQLKSFVSTGSGQMIWDLKQVMPKQSQLKLNSTLVVEPMNASGERNEITTQNVVDLTLTSN